jgi:hypothetical protein
MSSNQQISHLSSSNNLSNNNNNKSYRQRKWFVDFSRRPERYQIAQYEYVQPVGYTDKTLADTTNVDEGSRLNSMRSWDVALGPLKQAPMNVMISWMAGNSIALFPIMFVGMLLFRPFQSLFAMSKAFEAIEPGQYQIVQKLIYILGNFVNLAIALYKCHSMGLLPTYASDWLAFANPPMRMEYSYGGFSLN